MLESLNETAPAPARNQGHRLFEGPGRRRPMCRAGPRALVSPLPSASLFQGREPFFQGEKGEKVSVPRGLRRGPRSRTRPWVRAGARRVRGWVPAPHACAGGRAQRVGEGRARAGRPWVTVLRAELLRGVPGTGGAAEAPRGPPRAAFSTTALAGREGSGGRRCGRFQRGWGIVGGCRRS